MSDKDALRTSIRRSRASWSVHDRAVTAQAMRAVGAQLATLAGGAIAGFQPTNGEPDVGPLLTDLVTQHGVTVLIPRPAPHHRLEWVAADAGAFTGRRSGIPRPDGPVVVEAGRVADLAGVILVPALAIDPHTGARLGYGAGYYDRLLADLSAPTRVIGVCRATELITLPVAAHDVPVDSVLTQAGLFRVPTGG